MALLRATIASVVELAESSPQGLRMRKKMRTRAMLIDAAVQLCGSQGYGNTTVEQIAAVAGVSPRTFSRYFPTKEAVVLAMIDDLVGAIAERLARQPAHLGEFDALLAANTETIEAAESAGPGDFTGQRLLATVRIINSAPSLRMVASDFRHHAVTRALAKRMGVGLDDHRLRLVIGVWSAIVLAAFEAVGPQVERQQLTVGAMATQLRETYALFIDTREASR